MRTDTVRVYHSSIAGLTNAIVDEGVIDKNGWLAFLSELEAKVD